MEHRLKEMDARFHEQIRKNQALVREFELQTDRQKYMNKEYGEMRKQLGESGGKCFIDVDGEQTFVYSYPII